MRFATPQCSATSTTIASNADFLENSHSYSETKEHLLSSIPRKNSCPPTDSSVNTAASPKPPAVVRQSVMDYETFLRQTAPTESSDATQSEAREIEEDEVRFDIQNRLKNKGHTIIPTDLQPGNTLPTATSQSKADRNWNEGDNEEDSFYD
ncbi:unnamed protein product [Echinostoma caproni]|uniref:Centrosomal protein of 19 kDa n=1 Tax=Echinostoma caproni TaxID=27848 RepID=A0A183AYD0_9TREM|nr:unnamed protein product [Echinostoma caproni]